MNLHVVYAMYQNCLKCDQVLGQVIWQVLNQRLKQTRGQWAILLTWATIDIMKSDLWSLKQNMWKMSHTRFCIILYTWIINIKFRTACEAQEFTGAKVCIYVQPYIITFEFLWIISMFSFVKLEPLPPVDTCWYTIKCTSSYLVIHASRRLKQKD